DTETTELYALSLHDALPILTVRTLRRMACTLTTLLFSAAVFSASAAYPDRAIKVLVPYPPGGGTDKLARLVSKQVADTNGWNIRSEEHTSELQSREKLVCRL